MTWEEVCKLIDAGIQPPPICGGFDGPDVSYPEPTPEERELMGIQTKIAKQKFSDYQLLRPIIFQRLGYKLAGGKLVKMTTEEMLNQMTPLERLEYENAKLLLERQQKAIKGELPVSPALERAIEKQGRVLAETMSRKLGSNWETTTAGIQAKRKFEESAELMREQVRKGEMSGAGAAALALLNATRADSAYTFGALNQLGNPALVMNLTSQAIAPYAEQRANEFKSRLVEAEQQTSVLGALGSFLGGIASSYVLGTTLKR